MYMHAMSSRAANLRKAAAHAEPPVDLSGSGKVRRLLGNPLKNKGSAVTQERAHEIDAPRMSAGRDGRLLADHEGDGYIFSRLRRRARAPIP